MPTSKFTSKKFVWSDMPFNLRVERARERAHIKTELNDMEPVLTDKVFDFYGTYVKINENQKYKYAETKLILFYKSLIEELMAENSTLKDQVNQLLQLNAEYDRDAQRNQRAIDAAEAKTKRVESEIVH